MILHVCQIFSKSYFAIVHYFSKYILFLKENNFQRKLIVKDHPFKEIFKGHNCSKDIVLEGNNFQKNLFERKLLFKGHHF